MLSIDIAQNLMVKALRMVLIILNPTYCHKFKAALFVETTKLNCIA